MGHVTSYYSTGLQKYTSFQVHGSQEIRQLCATAGLVLCLSQTQLRGQLRRGLPAFTHSSAQLEDLQCLLPRGDTALLLAGHQTTMVSFDMVRAQQTQLVAVGAHGCAILRQHARLICCGAPTGRVTLRDPSSLRAQHTLDAHSASLNDLDVHNNLLVTCGFSHRGGKPAADRHLMMYDLRMLRAVSTIPVLVDPYLLKFIPSLSSRLAVVSPLGQLQIVETARLATPALSLLSVETAGSMCTAMDISANSQAMAFGDGGGCVHLLTLANQECAFNNYPRHTEFAEPIEPLPAIAFTDRLTPLATVPMAVTSEPLLSDWPSHWCSKLYRKPMKVDPVVLKTMRMVGTIGYAPNPGTRKRNQLPYRLGRPGQRAAAAEPAAATADDPFAVHVPKRYRKIDVKYSRNGLDEMDHLQYNRTSFSGLEASLPNSYCNAMLQVLYCLEPLRETLIGHLCQREFCLSCELSFLFHMLDTSQGVPCQASNFLRAFRTIPEATALGLILSDTLTNRQKINLPRLIQNWNRFILQQLDTECAAPPAEPGGAETAEPAGAGESPVARILGALSRQTTRCVKCGASSEKESTILLCNLTYPPELDDREVSFGQTLAASLCLQQTVQAWCELCGRYQPTEQVRHLLSLPHCLAVNCCTDNPNDLEFWRRQAGLLWPAGAQPESASAPPAPPSIKPCRYGAACTRADCHFWHGGRPAGPPPAAVDDAKRPAPHWLPHTIACQLHQDGTVSIADGDDEGDGAERSVYDLTAVVCHVSDPKFPDKNNLVALVRVGAAYHQRAVGTAVSQWYIFNDLGVTPVSSDEAVWLPLQWKVSTEAVWLPLQWKVSTEAVWLQWKVSTEAVWLQWKVSTEAVWLQWKVPTVLYYQSRRPSPVPAAAAARSVLTADTLLPAASVAARPAQTDQFTPLEPDELPAKGESQAAADRPSEPLCRPPGCRHCQ
ncbi:PAN2-PAN3 deadenylation complex catalytic subunit PAN2 [Amphibalanus amphitrite]|uniref:PAN2-PAN3 deadenylation complex catalytic subunit PAN2 n=1 Tax=Amphibalanus amphitrite TaxID=1232801 RepID=A0A6A4WIH6_AMPAM|nr:PAN2-PAN3 deadenylation complex catalytic subunit PAN2 [Amphibalanus amphitrite]